jgi:acyl transferase domain-containing protein
MSTSSSHQVQALSLDGRCKAFAADADGYGRGEGFASIVLEMILDPGSNPSSAASLSPYLLAVLAGSAVNQDGRSSGLTAPHGPSQAALVTSAMKEAGTAVLHLVATHGTGTPLGDPIESGALRKTTCSTAVLQSSNTLGDSALGLGGMFPSLACCERLRTCVQMLYDEFQQLTSGCCVEFQHRLAGT